MHRATPSVTLRARTSWTSTPRPTAPTPANHGTDSRFDLDVITETFPLFAPLHLPVWIAIGVGVLAVGRWQRACAPEEIRGGRATEYPLGARQQLLGGWLLLVFGVGFTAAESDLSLGVPIKLGFRSSSIHDKGRGDASTLGGTVRPWTTTPASQAPERSAGWP